MTATLRTSRRGCSQRHEANLLFLLLEVTATRRLPRLSHPRRATMESLLPNRLCPALLTQERPISRKPLVHFMLQDTAVLETDAATSTLEMLGLTWRERRARIFKRAKIRGATSRARARARARAMARERTRVMGRRRRALLRHCCSSRNSSVNGHHH